MKSINFFNASLIILLAFLSAGALFGGIALIFHPDGSLLKMPVEILGSSPFRNFLIPGIILLVIFGIFPVFVIYGLVKKPESRFFNHLNLLNDYHFSWTFAVYIGVGQVIWINIQTLILNEVGILHTIYSGLGLLIICIALLPKTRVLYKV